MKSITKTITILLWSSLGLLAQQTPPSQQQDERPLEVEYAPTGGFFEDEMVVELFSPGADIYYTTDGSEPWRKNDMRYEGPILVDRTTVIRAVAYIGGKKSNIFGHTYFIQEPDSNFPTLSIALNSSILFDPEHGLFMKGTNAIDSLWKLPGANFWSRKELPVNAEIYEANGQNVYRSLSGFRLFGGMSRLFPQKSFSLVARKRYGQKRIKHRIFGDEGLKKFKFLVLRNSGSDFGKTHFRDALMTSLVDDWDIEKQDYRPAHVYINGDYWGIYNFREKVNRYFIEGHHENVDKDSLDLIEHRLVRKRGSKKHYQKLWEFLETHSLNNSTNYAYIKSQMEVDNFMNYQIAQIYFDNQDAGGNIKFWRPHKPNGKWRWILFDTDWGFGLHNSEAYKNNSLAFHTEAEGPSWPNPPWSTFILRKLLENRDFEREFLNRFADHLNTNFESKRVLNKIDELYSNLLPEIPRHFDRWRLNETKWHTRVEEMRTFAALRPEYVRMHIMEKFPTGPMRDLSVESTKGGHVLLNENIIIEETFSGIYFQNIPVKLKAVPSLGYRFSHWEGINIDKDEHDLTLKLRRKEYALRAVFEKFEHPLAGKIMVNEISPNNKESGDWLEIYNNSDEIVNLKDWILTDSKNEFRFPELQISPKDYVVVCEDSAAFEKTFPHAWNFIGGLGFGLNKRKEIVRIFTPEGAAVDSIGYDIEPQDSVFTLNLMLPWLNNGDYDNWEQLQGYGTPVSANRYYVQSTIQAKRDLWLQIGGAFAVLMICAMMLFLKRTGKI